MKSLSDMKNGKILFQSQVSKVYDSSRDFMMKPYLENGRVTGPLALVFNGELFTEPFLKRCFFKLTR